MILCAAYAYALSALRKNGHNVAKKREKRAVTCERSTFREIRELKM